MTKDYLHRGVTWVDAESPTKKEINEIVKRFSLHPLVAEELADPTLRPKVSVYDEYIYLIVHFPIINHKKGEQVNQEVDFIVGKDFIVTTHYESIPPLHDMEEIFKIDEEVPKRKTIHGGFLFFEIIRHLYDSLENDLDKISEELIEIEEAIFEGRERSMVKKISLTGRHLLDFRRALKPHQEIFASYEAACTEFYGKEYDHYASALSGEYFKIWNVLENSREMLEGLRATNDALLNTKMNDVMKTLTIMAFVTFPLSLLASIFGMNTKVLPIVGHPYDFWIIIGIMVLGTIGFFTFFKFKKWL